MEFRVAGPADEQLLAELFTDIDDAYFRPHPFTAEEARRVAGHPGHDIYAVLVDDGRGVAYGLLRGWDEAYETPSLGIAVRREAQGRGFGRVMMAHLHHEARLHGAHQVRLRVHPENVRARHLYESLGYDYRGEERGELVMTLELSGQRHVPSGAGGRHGPPRGVHLLAPDDAAWTEWLEGVPHDVYHLAGYHSYAEESGDGEPWLAVVGNRHRGIAWPYLLRPVSEVPGLEGSDATDVTSVYGYPGPVAWGCEPGDPFLERAWTLIERTWREQGVVAAFTRFHPLLDNAGLADGFDGTGGHAAASAPVVTSGHTVSIDLTLDRAAVRAGYGRGLRREIETSRRAGLVTEHDERWAELARFSRLYHETMRRAGAADHYFFDELDFRRLHRALGERMHLLVTRTDVAVAAAGLFFELDGIVQWYLAGSDAAFRALSPSKVLVDDAIQWAQARGNRVLHLGGGRGGGADSLFWFKSRFSPRRHPFHTGRWILDPDRYDALAEMRLAQATGQGRPDPGYFPLYRAPIRPDTSAATGLGQATASTVADR